MKNIIPMIDLDSKDFKEKVEIALRETGNVNTHLINLSGRKKAQENLTFILMNTKTSKRKKCPACNAHHYYFTREFETEQEKDKTGLCPQCGALLVLLTLFNAPQDQIKEWIKSKGEINPWELIKDGIEKFIQEKKIKVYTTQEEQ